MKKLILLPLLALMCACESGSTSIKNSAYVSSEYSQKDYSNGGYTTKNEDKYISLVNEAVIEKVEEKYPSYIYIAITTNFLKKEEKTYYYESDYIYINPLFNDYFHAFLLSLVTDEEVTVNSLGMSNL